MIKSKWLTSSEILQIRNTKFLRVVFEWQGMRVGVTAVYRLPSLNAHDFLEDLHVLFQRPWTRCPLEIFCGDININMMDENSEITCCYQNCMNGEGYVSQINTTTRQDRLTKSCIDHFFVRNNDIDTFIRSVVLNCGLTDHFPILLNVEKNNLNNVTKDDSITKLPMVTKRVDYEKLQSKIMNHNWDSVYNPDINVGTEIFIAKLSGLITDCTQQIRLRQINKKKEWVTLGIITSIKRRDKLKKMADKCPNDADALEKFRKYRNMLSSLIKKSKYNFFKNKLITCKNDIKKTWEVIKQATNENKKCKGISLIKEGNEYIRDDRQIADIFLDYFGSIGNELASKIKGNDYKFPGQPIRDSMYLDEISEAELTNAIGSMKNRSAAGDDNISPRILKENHEHLLKPLLHLINLMFEKGVYPEILKRATIIPIYKAGDKTSKENYRPIAVTSCIARLFEKCVKLRLDSFLNRNKVLSDSQYGFRPGLSTEDAIVHVTEYVINSFNDRRKAVGVFVDLARAFDTVPHRILLKKLENVGIRGVVHNLIESYLSKRTQTVKINSTLSKVGSVGIGVPQGTVLGPILFSLYINDLFAALSGSDGDGVCYADDTVILVRGISWEETIQKAEECISIVRLWMDQNLLTMNVKKTIYVPFSMNNRKEFVFRDLIVHDYLCVTGVADCHCDQTISAGENVKYLGIFIDRNLKYESHIRYITQKIRKTIYKFYQLREFLTFKLLKMTYQALIESVLMYGLSIWGGACGNIIHVLNITQKYIIKIFMNKDGRHSSDLLFREADLLSVRQLYVRSVLKFMRRSGRYRRQVMHDVGTRHVNRGV